MTRYYFVFALVLLVVAPQSAQAYKFLCNGYDADGVQESDECGACTDESAPRWIPSSLDVFIDLNTRPKNISEADWKKVAVSSLDSWNDIAGVDLKLHYAGTTSQRSFGMDSGEHEIFWVTDKKEWRQKVGSGENGTLGVTVSPYQCPSGGRVSREIYDADLIMNGLGKFKWSLNCKEEGDCESIRSTLTHELGHFIGLGHPCALCSSSIMSAQAGYDIEFPVLDDFQAARALYPGKLSGQMGTRCDKEADCGSGLSCISQKDTKFCSQSCKESSCPNGYSCDHSMAEPFCRFSIGRLADTVGLHERCETHVCEDGLQCIETFTNKSFCVKDCTQKSDCPSAEECVLFADGGSGVCIKSVGLDQVCGEFTTCGDKMICVGKNETEGTCKYECHEGRRGQCRTGGVCTSVGRDLAACMDAKAVTSAKAPVEPTNTEANGPVAGAQQKDGPAASQPVSMESGCSCMRIPRSPMAPVTGLAALIIFAACMFPRRRSLLSTKSART